MSDINKKFKEFAAAIIDDANSESQKILEEVKRLHDTTMHDAEDEILNEVFKYIRGEVAAIKSEAGRRVSKQSLENKGILSKRRTEIAEIILEDVITRLNSFVKSPEYETHLTYLIDDALTITGTDEKLVILLRAEDMHLADKLKIKAKNAEFSQGIFTQGGVIIECPEKHISIDSTFDSAIKDLDGHFSEIFGIDFV